MATINNAEEFLRIAEEFGSFQKWLDTLNKENNYDYKIRKSHNVKPLDVPDEWLVGADQYQTDRCKNGMALSPIYHIAQEFKPTKENLTAVLLYFFNINAPSNVDITVSIRESLDGQDLTTMIRNIDDEKIKQYSVEFIKEYLKCQKYTILCQ